MILQCTSIETDCERSIVRLWAYAAADTHHPVFMAACTHAHIVPMPDDLAAKLRNAYKNAGKGRDYVQAVSGCTEVTVLGNRVLCVENYSLLRTKYEAGLNKRFTPVVHNARQLHLGRPVKVLAMFKSSKAAVHEMTHLSPALNPDPSHTDVRPK